MSQLSSAPFAALAFAVPAHVSQQIFLIRDLLREVVLEHSCNLFGVLQLACVKRLHMLCPCVSISLSCRSLFSLQWVVMSGLFCCVLNLSKAKYSVLLVTVDLYDVCRP